MNEVIAYRVRKKLNDDIENIKGKEYNLDSCSYSVHPYISNKLGITHLIPYGFRCIITFVG